MSDNFNNFGVFYATKICSYVLPALKNSDLATTKLWTTHIERITNYQLNAVIAKFKFKNEEKSN